MNFNAISQIVGKMGCMKFFPADVDARLGIAEEISEICHTEDEANWLAKRMIKLFPRGWPGVGEMRAVYCSKHKPKDGVEVYSDAYPDGIPSEKEFQTALPAAPMRALPSGNTSASPSIETTIRDLCVKTDLNRIGRPKPRVAEIPVIRVTEANRIQQADIDRALQLNREEKAKQEIGL